MLAYNTTGKHKSIGNEKKQVQRVISPVLMKD